VPDRTRSPRPSDEFAVPVPSGAQQLAEPRGDLTSGSRAWPRRLASPCSPPELWRSIGWAHLPPSGRGVSLTGGFSAPERRRFRPRLRLRPGNGQEGAAAPSETRPRDPPDDLGRRVHRSGAGATAHVARNPTSGSPAPEQGANGIRQVDDALPGADPEPSSDNSRPRRVSCRSPRTSAQWPALLRSGRYQ
jgi:hypothetical protein